MEVQPTQFMIKIGKGFQSAVMSGLKITKVIHSLLLAKKRKNLINNDTPNKSKNVKAK